MFLFTLISEIATTYFFINSKGEHGVILATCVGLLFLLSHLVNTSDSGSKSDQLTVQIMSYIEIGVFLLIYAITDMPSLLICATWLSICTRVLVRSRVVAAFALSFAAMAAIALALSLIPVFVTFNLTNNPLQDVLIVSTIMMLTSAVTQNIAKPVDYQMLDVRI